MHALLRHPPFPGHRQHLAAASGLQFLAVNGWQADLDPPGAAAIVIEALDHGRLTPAAAAGWLAHRLSPRSVPHPANGPAGALRRGLRLLSPLPGPGTAGMAIGGRMLARFTDQAAAVVASAQQEARRLGHDHLDPEHLLLGLISQDDGVAVQALNLLGVSLDDLRRRLHDSLGHGAAAVGKVRRHAWAQMIARHGGLPPVRLADRKLEGVTCVRLDATVTFAHSPALATGS